MKTKISYLAQLAAVLESSVEKPGNVSPRHSFSDTTYADFLLGSVALGSSIKAATEKGFDAGLGRIHMSKIGLGELILSGVYDIKKAHSGGNTHLGILMLFIPTAAAAGFCEAKNLLSKRCLHQTFIEFMAKTSVEDSLSFYEAIKLSDCFLESPLNEPRIPLHELMHISSERDRVASELYSGLQLSLNFSAPTLEHLILETNNLKKAIQQTYLSILAEFPDTLITKKAGIEKSLEVSLMAQEILEAGGVFSDKGISLMEDFNRFLCSEDNKLNPGTTADLTAEALFLWLLFNRSLS